MTIDETRLYQLHKMYRFVLTHGWVVSHCDLLNDGESYLVSLNHPKNYGYYSMILRPSEPPYCWPILEKEKK